MLYLFRILLIFIGLIPYSLFAKQEDNEKIVVQLATESQLLPIYLASPVEESSGLDFSYAKKLQSVLDFDLNNNGMSYTVKHTAERDKVSKGGSFDVPENASDWKTLNVFHVIKTRVKNKKLEAQVFSVSGNTTKSISGLSLTGDLSQDRRQIHLLADMIHKAIFGTEGIASTHLLYTLRTKLKDSKWSSDVWEMDYDGENARQVTCDQGYCVTPVYLPPKNGCSSGNFFYVSYKTGQSKIYVASLKDGIGRRFSSLKSNQLMPAISRLRDKVAFISDYTGNPDLFLQQFSPETGAIGKPQQIFATHLATQGSPTFHPDGNQVAFVSNKDGSPRIYVMEIPSPGVSLKDVKVKLISKYNRENSAPVWSPDGSKLAYCSMTNGVRQIWIYDFDTREERQITQGQGNKENPSWAPNSLHLVFNSTGKSGSEIYLVNLNQTTAKQITHGIGEKRFPSWEPRS